MKVYAEIVCDIKENDQLEKTLEVFDLIHRMEKYRNTPITYRMSIDNNLFIQAKEFAKEYSEVLEFEYSLFAKYDEEDMEQAVAYIPYFRRVCWKYDTTDVFCGECNECSTCDQIGDLEIKPQGSIKKYKDEYATFVDEESGASILSVKLYEYLCEMGIDKRYLRPVYSKRDKETPIAYQLFSEEILPEDGVKDPICNKEICKKCGRAQIRYSQPEEFSVMTMSREVLEKLKPVNMTYEYEMHFRRMVVSKEVYKLIKEKDPKARFEPIFLEK